MADLYYYRVQIAGREGHQDGTLSNKSDAIREVNAIVNQGGFGSAGAVWLAPSGKIRKLIYQCHVAHTKRGGVNLKKERL
jgi:hypothetical protein